MTDSSTITDHLLQAALRYLEHGDVDGLRAVLREHPEIAHRRGPDDGRGLIHAAAKLGRVDMLAVLLDAGADPNMPEGEKIDEEDRTVYQPGYVPLDHAARAGHKGAVDLLLARGALATATDHTGGTPLHAARTANIAEALLRFGADPNADCCMRYFDETLGWHFAGRPLHVAAQCGDVAMIRVLVGHDAKVDGTDHITARTALHYAAARGRAEAVEALLEFGADPDAMSDDAGYGQKWRKTPLHYAAGQGHEEVVRLLLKHGADARLKGGMYGETAADLALQSGHGGIATILAAATTIARDNTTTESVKEAGEHAPNGTSAAAKELEELFGLKDKGRLSGGPAFGKDTHAAEKPDFSTRDARRIKDDIVELCIADLEAMTEGLQSGDDSGLENIWEEICVQVQGEESNCFPLYEDIIDGCVEAQVKKLNPDEQVALWLTTDEGYEWNCDHQDDADGGEPVKISDTDISDIVADLRSCVFSEAADYENERIYRYTWGSGEDEEGENEEEDKEDNEDENEDEFDPVVMLADLLTNADCFDTPYPPAWLSEEQLTKLKDRINECIPVASMMIDLWDRDIHFEHDLSDDWYFEAVFGSASSLESCAQQLAEFFIEKCDEYDIDYDQLNNLDIERLVLDQASHFILDWRRNVFARYAQPKA